MSAHAIVPAQPGWYAIVAERHSEAEVALRRLPIAAGDLRSGSAGAYGAPVYVRRNEVRAPNPGL